jgi:hypothetical protein
MLRRVAPVIAEILEARQLLSNYFISPGGSDSAAGDAAHPWKTLQKAADAVIAGDHVTVLAGTYAGFVLGWDGPQSGTAAKPITFHANDGVVINSRNTRTPDGINLEGDCNYIVIEGFTVDNASGSITRAGIRVVGSDHVTIRNNRTDRNGTWGIFTGFADDLLIENNETSRSGREHGIYVSNSGDRPIIRNNHIWGNNANGIHMNGDLSQGGDGIISGALVSGNVIHGNGRAGGSGINGDGVQNSRFENNLLYDNHASGISLYRIDGAQGSRNNVVVNNTIIQAADARWAINIKDQSTGNRVFNNILLSLHSYRGGINITADSLVDFYSDYNAVIARFSPDDGESVLDLSEWRALTGQDTHSFAAAPGQLFADFAGNDFHLKPSSPALNAGTSDDAAEEDIEGRARPQGLEHDIGAYELATNEQVWRQTSAGDFRAGVRENVVIDDGGGGEVHLALLLSDGFNSKAIGDQWTVRMHGEGSAYSLKQGRIALRGGDLRYAVAIPVVAVLGRIAFSAGSGQAFGLGTGVNFNKPAGQSWAVFTTRSNRLYAQVNANGVVEEADLGPIPSGFHQYEVRPTANGMRFFIDNSRRANIALKLPDSNDLRALLSNSDDGLLRADWIRASAYRAAGTFTSSVFDAGALANWGVMDWAASAPAGTSIKVETSSGNTATADGSWSAWQAASDGQPAASASSRYLRYRITFSSPQRRASPVFSSMAIAWTVA